MKTLRTWFLALAVLSLAGVAQAQRSSDIALAEELYREARELMDQKRYDEACKKFAESQRLDPATGTLLNLAACHEALGLTATAWVEFGEALLAARRDQRPDRVQFAEQALRGIEPKLSRLTVIVPPESRIEGLEVSVDGAAIRAAAWGVSAPIDPGKHRIEASAPGRKSWSAEIEIGREADKQSIQVPSLEVDPAAVKVEAPPPAPVAPPPGQTPAPVDQLALERPVPASVFVAGGVTLAFAVAASVSGAVYLSKNSEYEDANEDLSSTREQRESLRDAARLPGVINAVTTGAALAGAVVTGVLYFTRPERPRAAKLRVGPWIDARGGGLSLSGAL